MSFEKHIMKRKKVPFLSFVLLGILIMGCVFAPFFCKDASYMDLMNCSRAPGCEFFFGTDTMGRDLFSCIWHGGRVSLTIGFYQLQYQQLLQFCMAQQVHCHLRGWIGF